ALHLRFFFLSSRRRHTRSKRDWSSDVCSSDLSRFQIGRSRPATTWMVLSVNSETSPSSACQPAAKHSRSATVQWLSAIIFSGRRSEERRVGKECRSRWAAAEGRKKRRRDHTTK